MDNLVALQVLSSLPPSPPSPDEKRTEVRFHWEGASTKADSQEGTCLLLLSRAFHGKRRKKITVGGAEQVGFQESLSLISPVLNYCC